MDCAQNEWLTDKEYLRQFRKKVADQRIPLSGSIELTRRCNMRCIHCYLGFKSPHQNSFEKELNTRQWIGIIDDIVRGGCLYLLITGGEPFLRNDFAKIYRKAKTIGLIVTVFSNGTTINRSIVDLFRELPPQSVEISLYGATEATYEKITGVKGSYKKCRDGIETLIGHGIRVKLKTVLMTANRHEFHDIENIAKTYQADFRFDPAIFPCFDGDPTPLEMRVEPKEIVEKEFSNKDRLEQWSNYFERVKGRYSQHSLYTCGAGRSMFHINSSGMLQPCLMVSSLAYDLITGDFRTGWKNAMGQLSKAKANRDHTCDLCDKLPLCGYCPAFFVLETGSESKKSDFLCELGEHRFQVLSTVN